MPSKDPALVNLTRLSEDLGAPLKSVRSLVIFNGVPFEVVGRCWVFGPEAVTQVRRIWAEHQRNAEALGLGPSRPRANEQGVPSNEQ
jgi:hypothetical protein